MSWQEFRQQLVPHSTSDARDDLADRFAPVTKERLELGRAVGSHGRTDSLHRVVPFKEAYSPALVSEVLDHFHANDGVVLDPFVGSGTTLLVAAERGLASVGVDVLPYAVFAASTLLGAPTADWQKVERLAERVLAAPSRAVGKFPDFPAGRWAFSGAALAELTTLHDALRSARVGLERDILRLALLTIVEEMSQATKDGTSLRRRPHGDGRRGRFGARRTRQHVRTRFLGQLDALRSGVADQPVAPQGSRAISGDARELTTLFGTGEFDFAVFSPPYPNRYDYVANYQLELGFGFVRDNAALKELRRAQLRSHLECPWTLERTLDLPALDELLSAVYASEHAPGELGRVFRMLSGYFEDMRKVFAGLHQVLAPGGSFAMVIGTQTYCGESLPTDLLLSAIAEGEGFSVEELWVARSKGVAVQQRPRAGRVTSRESVVLMRR
jgi:hypothetical protein